MRIDDTKFGEVLVLKPLDSRIDASASTSFKGVVVEKINEGNFKIVLDLSNIDFIDSSGLGSIVSSLKTLGDEGELVICGVKETVMSLFKITRMTRIFQFFKTPEEAVEKLTK